MSRIFASQGGGTVEYDELQRGYIFVDPPAWSHYQEGDLMPPEWGVAGPIN